LRIRKKNPQAKEENRKGIFTSPKANQPSDQALA